MLEKMKSEIKALFEKYGATRAYIHVDFLVGDIPEWASDELYRYVEQLEIVQD